MSGWLPDAEVAVGAMGLANQLAIIPWIASYAVGTAASARAANALGAGRHERAATIFR